ncbi:MAG: hypothetical protein NVS2B4_05390 [Ramlibacter sp.]
MPTRLIEFIANARLPIRAPLALAIGLSVGMPVQASCGSAFCSLRTDWGTGIAGLAQGSVLDLRYETINQDQPRTGSRKVAVGAIPRDHDEVSTQNRNLMATHTRSVTPHWGYAIAVPFVDRRHVHIANEPDGPVTERWTLRALGDVRLTARYHSGFDASAAAPSTAGIVFGLKLPTGRRTVANAQGQVAERTLQPGSGTTDAVVGAFYSRQLPDRAASWFAHAQYQQALESRDGFKPGSQLAADIGYARVLGERLAGVLQLNTVVKARDKGAQAEPDDSGSRSLSLSPGVSLQATDATRAYAFYQQPLHQSVNGVQLTARRAIVVGMSTTF